MVGLERGLGKIKNVRRMTCDIVTKTKVGATMGQTSLECRALLENGNEMTFEALSFGADKGIDSDFLFTSQGILIGDETKRHNFDVEIVEGSFGTKKLMYIGKSKKQPKKLDL